MKKTILTILSCSILLFSCDTEDDEIIIQEENNCELSYISGKAVHYTTLDRSDELSSEYCITTEKRSTIKLVFSDSQEKDLLSLKVDGDEAEFTTELSADTVIISAVTYEDTCHSLIIIPHDAFSIVPVYSPPTTDFELTYSCGSELSVLNLDDVVVSQPIYTYPIVNPIEIGPHAEK